MTYQLGFFCRAGEQTGQAALERLLDEVLSTGGPLPGERLGPLAQEVAAYRLATKAHSGQEVPGRLGLEIRVGVATIAESVLQADPDGERGIWGSDLLATITLSGGDPDWALVHRFWAALAELWSAVAWDEMSGFAIAEGGPQA
ncbi:hypothetical protein [Actinocorallia populi]|uniref:hypothetical protein n=1 Tax=Actinocorallia populi TaxID=2079200 RepID=UPI000D0946CD|nr:hypothetical protein [Actinocorallia populi]